MNESKVIVTGEGAHSTDSDGAPMRAIRECRLFNDGVVRVLV